MSDQKINKRITRLLDCGPAVIYAAKAYGDYGATFISGNVRSQMGYEPENFTNDSGFWANHIHPEDVDKVLAGLESIFKDGRHIHEYRFRKNNGEYVWMHDELILVRDDAGTPIEFIGYWQDISDRKEAEEQLRFSEYHAKKLLNENRKLTKQLIIIQEQERQQLARELHDEFGQWMAALILNAHVLCNLSDSDRPKMQKIAETMSECSTQLDNSIRSMLHLLRATTLDQLGLMESMQDLVAIWQKHNSDIHCELVMDGKLGDLGDEINITIYRVIQEALTNVTKHAGADKVTIVLRHDKGDKALQLIIRDNGRGFDDTKMTSGLGLLGMRERIVAVGGVFELCWEDNGGLCITINIPNTPDPG